MRSYSPAHLRYLLRSRLFGAADIREIADERVVVSQQEPLDFAPSIFLPHHLENIRRIHPETTQEQEDRRVHGGRGVHAAVEAFRISGVRYRDAGLYKKKWSRYFPKVDFDEDGPVTIEGGVYALSSTYSGIQYFGHWLRDDTTTHLLAESFAPPFCVRTPAWPHQPRYMNMFEVSWPIVDRADFDDLYVFIDYAQNSHKAARYREIRKRLRRNAQAMHGNHRVYLHRGKTGAIKRVMSNEAEVLKALADNGFVIVNVEVDSVDAIVSALLDAKTLVSIEGSHASPGIYTNAEGGGYVAISPPTIFNNVAKDWSSALGMKYGLVVGEEDGAAFKVNVRDLLTVVDMMEAAR
ncbi:glycosyltransferase 61 family protein [Hyphococcus sp.]|uniref:glycosyltransferase 61 family protein n=1 Tax=Hyphococcus sp. TaxID=2038636 RepID=UPI00208318CA|nr:MAG: hypothetical protein DHS20C04_08020 [Marinicaulis sp.]